MSAAKSGFDRHPRIALRSLRATICLDMRGELVGTGSAVVAGERNLEVIKTADRIIDLGLEGGDGEIVGAGTPEDVVKERRSYTGQYLKLTRGERKRRKVETAA